MRHRLSLIALMTAASLSWSQGTPPAKPAATSTATSAVKPMTHPTAIITTTAGKLTCELFPDKAPIGVSNFVGLARGTKDWTSPVSHQKKHGVPLYDGTIFHRVIPTFMIQGGDPAGTGEGDPGYKFKNETSPDLLFDRPGRLAYANAGPDTNGSQFFITEDVEHSQHLSGGYTIFGQCDDASVELVKQIARLGRDGNDRPYRPVKILHITINGVAPARVLPKGPIKRPAGTTASKPANPN
jgi:peptidyl-prolyl cis-trans isomerase A (cyclophilin A)